MQFMRWYKERRMAQCRRPAGLFGEYIARRMNRGHFALTGWGLAHVALGRNDFILDIGCGGGRTVSRLAGLAPQGLVCGIDVSEKSLAISRHVNRRAIHAGRVAIRQASVMALPFPNDSFHLATAVETHYFWPDLAQGLAEVARVLRPGGRLLLIAEVYRTERFDARNRQWVDIARMAYLDPTEFRAALTAAGFTDIGLYEHIEQGWLCCVGQKPPAAGGPLF